MSFYDDYVAEGLCCEGCGALIDLDEPGYARLCAACWIEERKRAQAAQAEARRVRKAARHEQG